MPMMKMGSRRSLPPARSLGEELRRVQFLGPLQTPSHDLRPVHHARADQGVAARIMLEGARVLVGILESLAERKLDVGATRIGRWTERE